MNRIFPPIFGFLGILFAPTLGFSTALPLPPGSQLCGHNIPINACAPHIGQLPTAPYPGYIPNLTNPVFGQTMPYVHPMAMPNIGLNGYPTNFGIPGAMPVEPYPMQTGGLTNVGGAISPTGNRVF